MRVTRVLPVNERPKKRRGLRKLLALLCALVLAGLLAAIVAEHWVIPAIIRSEATAGVERMWDGTLEIGEIDFNFFSPTRIHDVRLVDSQEREWLTVAGVVLHLRDFPGTHPVLTRVEVEGLNASLHLREGRLVLPLRDTAGPPPSWLDEYVDLREILAGEVTVSVHDETRVLRRFTGHDFQARREAAPYEVSLGRLVTDAGPLASDLVASVLITDGRFDATGFKASVCGGAVEGRVAGPTDSADADATSDQSAAFYAGSLVVRGVDIPALMRALAPSAATERGTLDGSLVVARATGRLEDLRAAGQVRLDDADLRASWLIGQILAFVGTDPNNLSGRTDMHAAFTLEGPVATIVSGRLADRLTAFACEPGGRINLSGQRAGKPQMGAKELDLYLVVGIVEDVRRVFSSLPIPFAGLVANVVQKLSRLHVVGRYDDPDSIRITKEPLKDIRDGTLEFFRDTVQAGGQLRDGLLRPLNGLLESLNPNHPKDAERSGGASAPTEP